MNSNKICLIFMSLPSFLYSDEPKDVEYFSRKVQS
jgi:hypothetical protein